MSCVVDILGREGEILYSILSFSVSGESLEYRREREKEGGGGT